VEKFNESAVHIVAKVCGSVSPSFLTVISFLIFGAIFLYELILMFVVFGIKIRGGCAYTVIQVNNLRRRVVFMIAWFYTAFWLLTLIPFDAPIASLTLNDVILPFLFLFLIYISEMVFSVLSFSKCGTRCDESPAVAHAVIAPASSGDNVVTISEVTPVEEPIIDKKKDKKKDKNRQEDEKKIVEGVEVSRPETKKGNDIISVFAPEPEVVEPAPVSAAEVASIIGTAPSAAMHKRVVKKATGAPRPRTTGTRAPRTPKKTPEELEAEKKKERIEELGAKIERQRRQAERSTDTLAPVDIPYAAGTQQARSRVEEAANKMDELQRRMETLRKTVTVRDVNAPETIQQNERKSPSDTHSITELRREQDRLKYQYEIMQHKLEQIANEKANVGYYSGTNNFERTGKGENLSKMPSRNKFDEEEVKAALLGLKNAIDDLQRKIDARADS